MNEREVTEPAHEGPVRNAANAAGGASAAEDTFAVLIDRARGGDASALNQLIESCWDYLMLVANQELRLQLRRKIGPSDLVQNACLLAHQNIEQFRGTSRPELLAWLRKILRNELCATYRHLGADKRNVDREEPANSEHGLLADKALRTPSAAAILQEEATILREALKRLSPDYRRVILLRSWDRLAFEEISCRMERSTDAVKKLWARAIQQLRRELNEERPSHAK